MPTLRQYVDGNGHYVSDYLHGVGNCTWQIGKEGLLYLAERGVRVHRDHVTGRYRDELKERGWIWFTGSNARRPPPGIAVLPGHLRHVAEGLSGWAAHGKFAELERVLHGHDGDQRDTCFSPRFLKWLSALDPGLNLCDLDDLSAPDFEDTAAPLLDRLKDEPLHGFFVSRGELHILWQLARFVAFVAQHVRVNKICPSGWQRQPVFQRLFSQLIDLSSHSAVKTIRWRPRRLARPPRIVWDINSVQITALLRPQILPRGSRGLTWRMRGEQLPQPQSWTETDGVRVEEACSRALSPATTYFVEVEVFGESQPSIESHRIELSADFDPCVLFAVDGEMIGINAERPLLSGEYIALVKRESAGQLFQRRGVRQVERIDIEPVGWHGWEGWRLRLDADAGIAPYAVDATDSVGSWELEPAPDLGIRWRETLPVYIGRWPRLFCTGSEEFSGAIIEVGREPSLLAEHRLAVGATTGVPIRTERGQHFLDLGAAAELGSYYGTVRLTCRLPSQPDGARLIAHFIRLPAMALEYVPDPVRPDRALSLHVRSAADTLADVVGDGETEVLKNDDGITLSAKAPHASPGVVANFVKHKACLRVRLPTTRLALVTAQRGFLGWQQPPLVDFDLSAIEAGDSLRVELHEQPELEDGRLLCRLIGGDEVAAGQLLGTGGPVWRFDIESHRWRDGFGLNAGGTIQARTCRRWADVVRLRKPDAPTLPQIPSEMPSERARLVFGLQQALAKDDYEEIQKAVAKCQGYIAGPSATTVDKELLLLAMAQASTSPTSCNDDLLNGERCLAALGPRPDMPEMELLRRA